MEKLTMDYTSRADALTRSIMEQARVFAVAFSKYTRSTSASEEVSAEVDREHANLRKLVLKVLSENEQTPMTVERHETAPGDEQVYQHSSPNAAGADTHALALRVVHAESSRTLSHKDFDMCMRIAKAAISQAPARVAEDFTYASKQAATCALCGEHKHTPLRIDWMGGYVCLTCIDRELERSKDDKSCATRYRWMRKHAQFINGGDGEVVMMLMVSFVTKHHEMDTAYTDEGFLVSVDASVDAAIAVHGENNAHDAEGDDD
ncbi:hypothetical protein G3O06_20610 [Burkholderia sp. Ac-20345]|uniref:hypothetical protein n=1 Tax=Burkholderia sp. Ac-20345 TaxID=2703891 RepID=UPI00197BA5DF|nr:hypothetical protein [Burkholderia sp. Ac-20345]MBN3779942.1 hypothetical protein [Burkholderia sp. Ac-20345]